MTLGVPRIRELIDATRNPKTPAMTLFVAPGYDQKEALEQLRLSLPETVLGRAVLNVELLLEPEFFRSERSPLDAHLASREKLLRSEAPGTFGLYVARMLLDASVLMPRAMSPSDVAELLESYCQCHVSASEELHEEWILRVRFTQLSASAGDEQDLRVATEEFVHRLCREVLISGVPGVQSAVAQEETYLTTSPEGFERQKSASIVTQGSNLLAALAMPQLQASRCVSNDIHEVMAVLGVEAGTAMLFEQIQYVLQFDGSYVNERHLLLLVSFMTCLGGLLPVSRHGINKLADSGPLARASFEEVADRLAESAVFGDVDPVVCHSARIMVGEACRVGTGLCDVLEAVEERPEEGAEASPEDEDVVFTSMDFAMMGDGPEGLCYGSMRLTPIEMPFSEDANCAPTQSVMSAALLHLAPDVKSFAPTSPKNLILSRKRCYEPSSPKRPRTLDRDLAYS